MDSFRSPARAARALATLPDSLAERRRRLREIVRRTPRDTELRQTAALMLRHLDEQDRARAAFPRTPRPIPVNRPSPFNPPGARKARRRLAGD